MPVVLYPTGVAFVVVVVYCYYFFAEYVTRRCFLSRFVCSFIFILRFYFINCFASTSAFI